MTQFTVVHLHEDRLEEAFPLVRMAAPAATPAKWRSFVHRVADHGGGVLAVLAGDGRPHGIAVFRTDECLGQGRTLHVEPMVTFELNQSAPARAALCQALELLASVRGCDTLEIVMASRGYADPNGPKARPWGELGLTVSSITMAKQIGLHRAALSAASGLPAVE